MEPRVLKYSENLHIGKENLCDSKNLGKFT